MENFFWVAAGIAALLAGLGIFTVLVRLRRTLAVLEVTMLTAEEAIRATVPEVSGSLGNVNAITAGVNVGMHAAARGASRLGEGLGERAAGSARGASATWYGMKAAGSSLWRSYEAAERRHRGAERQPGPGRSATGGGGDG